MRSQGFRIGLLYIVGSLGFLLLPIVYAPGTPSWDMFKSSHLRRDLVTYALILGFYYLNLLVLIPRMYFEKRLVLYWTAASLLMLLIVVLPTLLLRHHPHYPHPPYPRVGIHLYSFSHPFFVTLMSFFFSMLVAIQTRWKQSERDRLRAELSYLKAQINPHFLFNSLNSIYALAIEKSDLAPEAVLKLAGMMRYVLAESDKESVTIQQEISYLSDYIALQKIRLGSTAQIEYKVSIDQSSQRISPLLLIPFFENAFKHGVNAEQDSHIQIELTVAGKALQLRVANNKVSLANAHEKTGIGMNNTRDRLQALYPGRHLLIVEEDDTRFSILLNIQL